MKNSLCLLFPLFFHFFSNFLFRILYYFRFQDFVFLAYIYPCFLFQGFMFLDVLIFHFIIFSTERSLDRHTIFQLPFIPSPLPLFFPSITTSHFLSSLTASFFLFKIFSFSIFRIFIMFFSFKFSNKVLEVHFYGRCIYEPLLFF